MKCTALAAGLAAVLTSGLTVATAPSAGAAPARVDYTCESPTGQSQLSITYETVLPDPPAAYSLAFGVDPWSTVRVTSAVPGALAQQAADEGAQSVSVSGSVDFRDASTAGFQVATFSDSAPLGDQTTARDVPFTAGADRLWVVEPGLREVTAKSPTVTFTFREGDGDVVEMVTLTCATPSAPVIDTVRVVSTSALRVTLGERAHGPEEAPQPETFAYGQPVPVRASVRVLGTRKAAGWVDFTLDGVTRRAAIDADGNAGTTLPGPSDRSSTNLVVSPSNYVLATYVPAEPEWFESSTAPPTFVPLTPARTEPRVRVTGKRPERRTKVHVRVVPPFDSTPTGTVRVNLRKLGTTRHWSRSRTIKVVDDRSKALAGFGRLPSGRYRVVVKYRGDADHLGSRAFEKFRVRR